MEGDVIFYQFSRSKVERCDFSHFLSLYAPDKLPEGRPLRDMMNCLVFCIEGWDSDPREIHAIPEVTALSTRRGPVGSTFVTSTWTRCGQWSYVACRM
jgi:hypothetical protein